MLFVSPCRYQHGLGRPARPYGDGVDQSCIRWLHRASGGSPRDRMSRRRSKHCARLDRSCGGRRHRTLAHCPDGSSSVSISSYQGTTALHMSAEEGHLATSKVLVEAGSNLNAVSCSGHTPLHLAAARGRGGVVRLFIEKGANVNRR